MINIKKKVMFCFYKGAISNNIGILEELDLKGFEVHIFNDIDETNIKYDILPELIKEICTSKEYKYDIYISSNVKEFIMLQYVLYKQLISAVLYLNTDPEYFQLEELYKLILNNHLTISSSNFYVLRKEDYIFNNYKIFNGDFELDFCKKFKENIIYNFMGIKHIFSISIDENINIINLDNSLDRGIYKYHFNLKYVDKFLKLIRYYSVYINEFLESHSTISVSLNEMKDLILNLYDFEKRIVKFKLEDELYNNHEIDSYKIFLSSILVDIFKNKKYIQYLMKVLLESKTLNKYNKFFAYYQCIKKIFVNPSLSDETTINIIEKLYDNIFMEFSNMSKEFEYITKDSRNNELVFVFTSQFLGINHSPSKIALDVCYNLVKSLNKNAILINTREILTTKGIISMSDITSANIIDSFNNVNFVPYKDIEIPFYQPQSSMPNDDEIVNILNMVSKYAPSLIINIGTCLIGDLCTHIVPTVTVPTASNGYSRSTFYVVDGEKGFVEYNKKQSRTSESLIISKYACELKEKRNIFTKEQLGIPSNKFILGVVGIRLNLEIDDDFLNMLEKCCESNNAYVLFIDGFQFNQLQINKYKNLINNYKNMGYQGDLLAALDNIDVYVNPSRTGGGASAIYALYLGKPVITLDYGDVADNVGKVFCVYNYNEMIDKINKYYSDSKFYNEQSDIAKKTALKLTDVCEYVSDVYKKVTKSPLYNKSEI